jgi:hypothetical protein
MQIYNTDLLQWNSSSVFWLPTKVCDETHTSNPCVISYKICCSTSVYYNTGSKKFLCYRARFTLSPIYLAEPLLRLRIVKPARLALADRRRVASSCAGLCFPNSPPSSSPSPSPSSGAVNTGLFRCRFLLGAALTPSAACIGEQIGSDFAAQ